MKTTQRIDNISTNKQTTQLHKYVIIKMSIWNQ